MRLSVIVPVRDDPDHLRECLTALVDSLPEDSELIVVDDASADDTVDVARALGARVIQLGSKAGPGIARNHGAAVARGDILFFVDADVVVARDAVERVLANLADDGEIDAVFGSYDARPRAPGLVSQYRNLLHHYVHQRGHREASTFWSGCGAIRRTVFQAVGGFDRHCLSPALEDVEFGYRLRAGGYRVRLDKTLQGCHLKRWTLGLLVRTDIMRRALPWARLILERRVAPRDLNLALDQRLSLACVALAIVLGFASVLHPLSAAAALALLLVTVGLNVPLYRFLRRQRGLAFAVASVPLHLLYFLCGGLGFVYAWLTYRRPRHQEALTRVSSEPVPRAPIAS